MQLLRGTSTPQAVVRELKKRLSPSDSNTKNLLRIQYKAHLEKAKTGRSNVDKWFNDWQALYAKA
ncbi:hypothetical protein Ptr902_13395 [Pyrenophora tritici-repentis]|nr:hypothetical protein Ptr902_13395 [Pyrenophora tritici-repentis]